MTLSISLIVMIWMSNSVYDLSVTVQGLQYLQLFSSTRFCYCPGMMTVFHLSITLLHRYVLNRAQLEVSHLVLCAHLKHCFQVLHCCPHSWAWFLPETGISHGMCIQTGFQRVRLQFHILVTSQIFYASHTITQFNIVLELIWKISINLNWNRSTSQFNMDKFFAAFPERSGAKPLWSSIVHFLCFYWRERKSAHSSWSPWPIDLNMAGECIPKSFL